MGRKPNYEFLEGDGIGYTIRLPANRILQDRIGYLLNCPVGRPPHEVRRYFASFGYQLQCPGKIFKEIPMLIARLRVPPAPACKGDRVRRDRPRRQRCALSKAHTPVPAPLEGNPSLAGNVRLGSAWLDFAAGSSALPSRFALSG